MNSCEDIEDSGLDEDIKYDLLGKLRILKCEYELMKATLIKNAFKWNNKRRKDCLPSSQTKLPLDGADETLDSNLLSSISCDKLMLDDSLWKNSRTTDDHHSNKNQLIWAENNEDVATDVSPSKDQKNLSPRKDPISPCKPSCASEGQKDNKTVSNVPRKNGIVLRKSKKKTRDTKSSCLSTTSPVLGRKNNIVCKKRKRKFFPKIPIALLRNMTNSCQTKEFTLPDDWLGESRDKISEHFNEGEPFQHSGIMAPVIKSNVLEDNIKKDSSRQEDIDLVPLEIAESHSYMSVVPEARVISEEHTTLKSTHFSARNIDCSGDQVAAVNTGTKKNDEHCQSSCKVLKTTLRFYDSRGFLALSSGDNTTNVHEKSRSKPWTCVWESKSKVSVDEIQWLMSEACSSNLLLLKVNWETSIIWVSCYDAITGVGMENMAQLNVKELKCFASLPSLNVAVKSNKLVKYWIDISKRSFKKPLVLVTAEDEVLSLCSLNQQPNGLLGISTSHIYIWNHMTGSLLQRIVTSIHLKSLLDVSSCNGVVMCHVIMESDEATWCACIGCNPTNGRSALVCKQALDPPQERCNLTVNDSSIGFVTLHDYKEIRLLLENFSSLPSEVNYSTRQCCKPTNTLLL